METRRDYTTEMANVSVMLNSQKMKCYSLPELQRNVPAKHILHNIEPNQRLKPNAKEIIWEIISQDLRCQGGRQLIKYIHVEIIIYL